MVCEMQVCCGVEDTWLVERMRMAQWKKALAILDENHFLQADALHFPHQYCRRYLQSCQGHIVFRQVGIWEEKGREARRWTQGRNRWRKVGEILVVE
jgi:hypothetical protein